METDVMANPKEIARGDIMPMEEYAKIRKARRPDPSNVLALQRRHCSAPYATHEKRHQQVKVFVAVGGEGKWRQTAVSRVDTQLLAQFADQGLLGNLAVVHLAAGEFP